MKITAQKGKANKIHISIDGEYRFTVDADFWFSQKYAFIAEIDEAELESLALQIAKRRCFNRALNILSRRDHSEKELLLKLSRADGEQAASTAVERVKLLGYINDERYAESFASELARRKGMSARGIKAELIRRGIDRETAENATGKTALDECDRIDILLQGRFSSRLSDEKGRKQTINALLRLGYSYSDIRSAMRRCAEFSEDDDYE